MVGSSLEDVKLEQQVPYPDSDRQIIMLAIRLWGSDNYSVVASDAGEDGYFLCLNKGTKTMAATEAGLGEQKSYEQLREHLLAHLRARIDGDKAMLRMIAREDREAKEKAWALVRKSWPKGNCVCGCCGHRGDVHLDGYQYEDYQRYSFYGEIPEGVPCAKCADDANKAIHYGEVAKVQCTGFVRRIPKSTGDRAQNGESK